ncbi:MAG TPA: DNA polymerase I [Gammaproteobacteria bacterium]|jgi:DNA polymerase-1|nr:DNA polymerase I [Gammaproteobacteria bacterium]
MSAKPLVLVDGSSYLYRAFHALPALSTASGEPTGAVLGVVNMLYKLLDEVGPERMAVVFDAPGRTFRDDLYAEYKAHRPPMPDELRAQVAPLLEAIEAMGIPLLRIEGVEADDVIGTLARQASAAGTRTVISTGDKDLAQLVDERVTLVNTMDNTTLDRAGVQQKFGVTPEQIIDYLALVGDTSDNIPGVPGVGPKTAAKWLQEFGDLDTLKARASEVGGKIGERLRESLGVLDLSKQLATIRCDLDLPLRVDNLALRAPDKERLAGLFERLEFSRLLRRVRGDAPTQRAPSAAPQAAGQAPAAPPAEVRYETVLTEAALEAWCERLKAAPLVALDTETTSLAYMRAELVGISLAVTPGEAAYIPLAHRYPGAPDQLDRERVLARLKPWLESAAPKLGHHLKYDAHIFENHGVKLGGIEHDTMLESYVLNSTATRHDMDSVAALYLGVGTIKYEDVVGKGAKQITFDQVDLDTATRYAAEDADVTLRLHEALWPKLQAEPALAKIYTELERPLIRVLERMEYTGVRVDAQRLREQSQELATKMAATEQAAYAAAGGPFNLGSPKQLQEVLYERLKLPVLGKTQTGQPSTAEDVLEQLAEEHELPRLVLEYRGLSKLKSTYTDKLPGEIDPRTGRIHTSYHQAVAATGRLSSSDPNLQNIPIRTPEGRRIRQAFVAPPGCKLLAADYSQIELRIMAHLSGDEGLLAAFAAGEDIHRATAAEVFGVALADVTADQRRSAKAINFGLIYGMSAFGLARQLGLERAEAQTYVDRYFERYPGVKRYMEETRAAAHRDGFVSTVLGRRLYLPEINARNTQRRQYAERSAINAPMQGTAADIIKRAMIDVAAWLERKRPEARLIMQVHDELVIEVPERQAEEVGAEVAGIMEAAASLRVPLRVDRGLGANWDEAH